jgi:hypothetical protein
VLEAVMRQTAQWLPARRAAAEAVGIGS